MAAYGRATLNRGGRNSRFDCKSQFYVPKFGPPWRDFIIPGVLFVCVNALHPSQQFSASCIPGLNQY